MVTWRVKEAGNNNISPLLVRLVGQTFDLRIFLTCLSLLSSAVFLLSPEFSTMSSQAKMVQEKQPGYLNTTEIDEEPEALEGYIVDPSRYADNAARLKTSPDGRYVLIPQPLDTPDDPLNWSGGKKWAIIAIVAYIALLADYTGGTAIITVIPQSM